MEQDREDLCGPRWKRDPDRSAGRGGTTQSEVTFGGRRIVIKRPRVRSKEGEEVELRVRRRPRASRSSRAERRGLRPLESEVRAESRPASERDRRSIDLEEFRLVPLRGNDDEADDELIDDAAGRSSLSDHHDRWHPSGRSSCLDRSGHRL